MRDSLSRCPPPPAFRPFDKLRDRKLEHLPRFPPQFVELVETNPEVTPTLAPGPRPFDRLKDLPPEFAPVERRDEKLFAPLTVR